MSQPNEQPRSETAEVLKGIGLALLVLPVQSAVTGILTAFAGLLRIHPPFGILSVLVSVGYFVIAFRIARRNGRQGIIKGMIIGISLMVLLVSACFGLMIWWISMQK